ncbi:hypothetical protein LCGC14_1843450 [marine sediment metagenome]|uniref:Uncharacterized protein n=1 Tax=marine sediment metagenome TaxID=412755 RepID=A0A0F9GCN7_9ZZZZ
MLFQSLCQLIVINLEFLLYHAYNLLIKKEGTFTPPLKFPKKEIKNPALASKQVLDEMLGRRPINRIKFVFSMNNKLLITLIF